MANQPATPKAIEDCEVVPTSIRVQMNVIGTRKYDRAATLHIVHNHHINQSNGEIGIVDVIITKEQIVDLISQLDKAYHYILWKGNKETKS